jgi:hypothetical protein
MLLWEAKVLRLYGFRATGYGIVDYNIFSTIVGFHRLLNRPIEHGPNLHSGTITYRKFANLIHFSWQPATFPLTPLSHRS